MEGVFLFTTEFSKEEFILDYSPSLQTSIDKYALKRDILSCKISRLVEFLAAYESTKGLFGQCQYFAIHGRGPRSIRLHVIRLVTLCNARTEWRMRSAAQRVINWQFRREITFNPAVCLRGAPPTFGSLPLPLLHRGREFNEPRSQLMKASTTVAQYFPRTNGGFCINQTPSGFRENSTRRLHLPSVASKCIAARRHVAFCARPPCYT